MGKKLARTILKRCMSEHFLRETLKLIKLPLSYKLKVTNTRKSLATFLLKHVCCVCCRLFFANKSFYLIQTNFTKMWNKFVLSIGQMMLAKDGYVTHETVIYDDDECHHKLTKTICISKKFRNN